MVVVVLLIVASVYCVGCSLSTVVFLLSCFVMLVWSPRIEKPRTANPKHQVTLGQALRKALSAPALGAQKQNKKKARDDTLHRRRPKKITTTEDTHVKKASPKSIPKSSRKGVARSRWRQYSYKGGQCQTVAHGSAVHHPKPGQLWRR